MKDFNIVGIITQSLEQATSTAPTTPIISGDGGISSSSIDNYVGENYGGDNYVGLSSLTLSQGTLNQATSSATSYSATVASSVDSITVTPTFANSLATIMVNNVPVSGLTGVKAIVGGIYSGYALKSDGTVWAWGLNNYEQLRSPVLYSSYPLQVSGLKVK